MSVTREKGMIGSFLLNPWPLILSLLLEFGVLGNYSVWFIDWAITLARKAGGTSWVKDKISKIMTLFCITPVHTGDQRNPLGDIAGFTLQPALKSWELILNWSHERLCVFKRTQADLGRWTLVFFSILPGQWPLVSNLIELCRPWPRVRANICIPCWP